MKMKSAKKLFTGMIFLVATLFLFSFALAEDIVVTKTISPFQVKPGEEFLISVNIQNNLNHSVDVRIFESQPVIFYFRDYAPFNQTEVEYVPPYISLNETIPAGASVTENFYANTSKIGVIFIESTTVNVESNSYFSNSLNLTVMCNQNDVCEGNLGEDIETCSQDCKSGSADGICDFIKDGRVDPDCLNGVDPDWNSQSSGGLNLTWVLFSIILAIVIVLIVLFFILRNIHKRNGVINLYRKELESN